MSSGIADDHREILSLICEVSRAVKCCQQEEAFCEGVTFFQFLILDAVGEAGSLELSSLHGILAVEKSTTTRMVDPLARRGLIVRQQSRKDSRAVNLRLTAEGEAVLKKVWKCLAASLDAIARRIPAEKRSDIYESVRLFAGAVQQKNANGRCCVSALTKDD